MLNNLDIKMPKLATTHSLSNYQKLKIAAFKDSLLQSQSDHLNLSYNFKGKPYSYRVNVSKTACNYGGYRYWFNCPNCNKRVGVLYLAGVFVCRHCIGANYASQLEQPYDMFHKVEKIRHRLGWQAGIANGHGAKPKGMHYQTYFKLTWQHTKLVEQILGVTCQRMNITLPSQREL